MQTWAGFEIFRDASSERYHFQSGHGLISHNEVSKRREDGRNEVRLSSPLDSGQACEIPGP